jgi:transcription initiation factor TFIID TATA-box-binding protein
MRDRAAYVVRNLVVTTKLAETFALDEIVKLRFGGSTPRRLAKQWVGVRVEPNSRYVAFYPNGNVLVAGCVSLEESRSVLRGVERVLADFMKEPVSSRDIIIQNIVATSDLGRTIGLEEIAGSLQPMDVEFEPEQFPAVILRIPRPSAVVLLFSSGKFVVTGTREFEDLDQVVSHVRNLLGVKEVRAAFPDFADRNLDSATIPL